MAIRFADDSGGLSTGGILFAQQSEFAAGVSATMAVTLDDAIMFAQGAVQAVYIEDFDVQLNITPNFVDNWWAVISSTMAPTLEDAVMFAQGSTSSNPTVTGSMAATLDDATADFSGDVGQPIVGNMNVTLQNATMSAAGFPIVPITGDMNITLDDAVMVAGNENIAVKNTKVHVQFEQNTKVWVR